MINGNKTYYISTFGCQMNAHDSEKLAGILRGKGYSAAESLEEASLVVFNTCCIRENAENRVYGNLSYLKHLKSIRSGLIVAVGGCMPQQDAARERLSATGAVDILFGTHNLHTFGTLLDEALETGRKVSEVWEGAEAGTEGLDALEGVRENPWRSGVNIMYGCDNFCSYCVVPYVRGRERSRAPEDILAEVRSLVQDGVAEITLLGQNVNSYGRKGGAGGLDFPGLLRAIDGMDTPPERIRFMTSHPKDLSPELIEAVKDCNRVCKHIHLPVQSGSSRILGLMNRKYDREGYLALVHALRRAVPGISITTDIIVGFPGETEEDFAETLTLAEEARYSGAFTFIYSPREGTKAAQMEDRVPKDITGERFQRLLDVINPIALEWAKAKEGTTLEVLAERLRDGVYTGRADDNSLVHFTAHGRNENVVIGHITPVQITEGKTFFLLGEAK